ncbi:MAG: hypothetical protein KDA25_11200, partial [Phycisphaerales bacterium]|nr:hypothetical protein [Phycisphaerales bacterium]
VVVEGNERLFPMTPVRPIDAGAERVGEATGGAASEATNGATTGSTSDSTRSATGGSVDEVTP